MLGNTKEKIDRLLALYEQNKAKLTELGKALEQSEEQVRAKDEQIVELKREIDGLKLKSAIVGSSADNAAARKKVDELIGELDKCIAAMEN